MPLFALFIAQSLSEMISQSTPSEATETGTTINDGNEIGDADMTSTTIGKQEPTPMTEVKLESFKTSNPIRTTYGSTTATIPKVSNTDAPATSQIPNTPSHTESISQSESITTPKIRTTAVTCNKTTSLLSESQKFTTLMFFFGLPIGLLLVLVGTLSVALLLVTRKRMTLRKGVYLSETIP